MTKPARPADEYDGVAITCMLCGRDKDGGGQHLGAVPAWQVPAFMREHDIRVHDGAIERIFGPSRWAR